MKTAYCYTLKNGLFQCKFIPQKSLHLIKYIQFVGKMERLLPVKGPDTVRGLSAGHIHANRTSPLIRI